jgi:hypothetical protein
MRIREKVREFLEINDDNNSAVYLLKMCVFCVAFFWAVKIYAWLWWTLADFLGVRRYANAVWDISERLGIVGTFLLQLPLIATPIVVLIFLIYLIRRWVVRP